MIATTEPTIRGAEGAPCGTRERADRPNTCTEPSTDLVWFSTYGERHGRWYCGYHAAGWRRLGGRKRTARS